MQRISYNSLKIIEFFDKLNPKNSGILFSIIFHFIIVLFAVGLPNIFSKNEVFVPNIIPIEILNVSDTTNIQKSDKTNDLSTTSSPKQKKFNSSENSELKKDYSIKENSNNITIEEQSEIIINQKVNQQVAEKKEIKLEQKNIENKLKVETIKTKNIKPKIKPKQSITEQNLSTSDIQLEPKPKKEIKDTNKKNTTKPKPKPEEDFNIASMLKDLRNEQSNDVIEEKDNKENIQTGENLENESSILSITEIDLLRQQLSSCWNAPAGAVINIGDKVTISAKVQQNMKVYQSSVRIVDTNISKSNPFYGPITDSAMRTLLNPECTPLKLPKDKYNLWKNLTITFDYSIMKGY